MTYAEHRQAQAESREIALRFVRKALERQRAAERETLETARHAKTTFQVSEAALATALGISRPTLRKRLAALDVDDYGTPPMM